MHWLASASSRQMKTKKETDRNEERKKPHSKCVCWHGYTSAHYHHHHHSKCFTSKQYHSSAIAPGKWIKHSTHKHTMDTVNNHTRTRFENLHIRFLNASIVYIQQQNSCCSHSSNNIYLLFVGAIFSSSLFFFASNFFPVAVRFSLFFV